MRCNPDTEFNRRLLGAVVKNDLEGLRYLLQENGAENKIDLHATFRCPGNGKRPRWENIVWFSCKAFTSYKNKLEILRLLLNTSGAKRTLNTSLVMISIAKIKQLRLVKQLKMLREFGADPSVTNHLGLNALHFLMESKRYCDDTINAILHGLSLDETCRLVSIPYPESHGLTKWRGLTPIQIAEQEKHLHGLIKLFKKHSAIKEWRPRLHQMFSRNLRLEIKTLTILAQARPKGEKKEGNFKTKYPQACLDLLPVEVLQYIYLFIASPPFPVTQNLPVCSDVSSSDMRNQNLFLPLERNETGQGLDEEANAFDFNPNQMG